MRGSAKAGKNKLGRAGVLEPCPAAPALQDRLGPSLHADLIQATASVGAVYEGPPENVGQVWQRAARAGARNVLLDVRADGTAPEEHTGRVRITVIHHDPWPPGGTTARGLREEAQNAPVTPASRQFALKRITARRGELLQELALLAEIAAGHETALASTQDERTDGK